MTLIPFTKNKKKTPSCAQKTDIGLPQAITSALSPKGAGVRCGNKHYFNLFEGMTVYNIFRRKHSHLVPGCEECQFPLIIYLYPIDISIPLAMFSCKNSLDRTKRMAYSLEM